MDEYTYNEFLGEDIVGSVLQQLFGSHRFFGNNFGAETIITKI